MKRHDYYTVAVNDLQYLYWVAKTPIYNNTVVIVQQAAEKALKSLAEQVVSDRPEQVLKTHNLRSIVAAVNGELPDGLELKLNVMELAFLKDFYFDARYPGENYMEVTREECQQCLDIMHKIFLEVNRIRKIQGLDTVEPQRIVLDS